MLASILVGVLSSLTASLLFLLILSRMRPNVDIAPEIAKGRIGNRDGYSIKIINRTKWPIVGARIRMTLATLRYVRNGPIYNLTEIGLKTTQIMEIPKFDKNDRDARYAIQFEILDDLGEKWVDNETTHVRFQIYATHSFTGFGKAFEERYFEKTAALKEGIYAAGDTFSIS